MLQLHTTVNDFGNYQPNHSNIQITYLMRYYIFFGMHQELYIVMSLQQTFLFGAAHLSLAGPRSILFSLPPMKRLADSYTFKLPTLAVVVATNFYLYYLYNFLLQLRQELFFQYLNSFFVVGFRMNNAMAFFQSQIIFCTIYVDKITMS